MTRETSKSFRIALCLTTKSGSEYMQAGLGRNQLNRWRGHRANGMHLHTPRLRISEEMLAKRRKSFAFFGLDKAR
jgi:hypothetical protein